MTYSYIIISKKQFHNTITYAKAIYYHKLTDGREKINVEGKMIRSIDIYNNILIRKTFYNTIIKLKRASRFAFINFLILSTIWVFWFYYRGKKLKDSNLLRGHKLIDNKLLCMLLQQKKIDSDYKIDNLPLVRDKETSHFLITGTTGSGKTNFFNTILPQIRRKKQKAIIIDTTGEYVSKYYDKNRDIIINPFDSRSAKWSIWAECKSREQFDMLATSLIPDNKHSDPFWVKNSRSLLAFAAHKTMNVGKIKYLLDILLVKPLKEIQSFFLDSTLSSLMSLENEKTTLSLRATLASYLKCLEYTNDYEDSFSIKEWIKDDNDGWLFLTSMPDQRETLKPLLSSLFDIAVSSLMTLSPNKNRRCWFIVDELASLQMLPSLPTALAEIRKYGGCIMSGTQSIHQIKEIYGHNIALTMFELFNTRIFFRTLDPDNAHFIAKSFGDREYTEMSENISYGANDLRDGIALSENKKIELLILPMELMKLTDLEAFIYFPGGFITKIKMKYKNIEYKSKSFIAKTFNDAIDQKNLGYDINMKTHIEENDTDRKYINKDIIHEQDL
ncbi:MAG: DUF87 domain-containing protein [Rickettsiales bacterium]|nr:MAG: DUF87 domain-containing protein [Rickettsiales bacterium]